MQTLTHGRPAIGCYTIIKRRKLIRHRQVLGRKERCWYRLHESKLFTLELGRAAAGDVPVCVFELGKGATVAKRPGVCYVPRAILRYVIASPDDILQHLRAAAMPLAHVRRFFDINVELSLCDPRQCNLFGFQGKAFVSESSLQGIVTA